MMPTNTKYKEFTCKQCNKICKQLIVTKLTKKKYFCDDCSIIRNKVSHDAYAKKNKISTGNKIGRPKNEENVNILYKSNQLWDETLEYV